MVLKEFKKKIAELPSKYDDFPVVTSDSENGWFDVEDVFITDKTETFYPTNCVVIDN